jgi:MFS family permease
MYGGLGLALVATLVGSIGLAPTALWVFIFYLVGMTGSGMFHPIAASTIGALNPLRRSQLVTFFFIAGMLGGVTGSVLAPRLLVQEHGFVWLRLLIVPAVAVAIVLHRNIRSIPHRIIALPESGAASGNSVKNDWWAIAMLYLAAAARFTVNIALLFLYARWMEQLASQQLPGSSGKVLADAAAPWVGNLNASTMLGMAIGGLLAGTLIPAGREKWPLVFVPVVFAPAIACFSQVSREAGYGLAVLSGIGFASMVPVTLAVAQRLLPMRTSLASGLMLGGAWSIAMTGPVMAEWVVRNFGLATGFRWTAILLAVSGCLLLPIRSASINQSVGR